MKRFVLVAVCFFAFLPCFAAEKKAYVYRWENKAVRYVWKNSLSSPHFDNKEYDPWLNIATPVTPLEGVHIKSWVTVTEYWYEFSNDDSSKFDADFYDIDMARLTLYEGTLYEGRGSFFMINYYVTNNGHWITEFSKEYKKFSDAKKARDKFIAIMENKLDGKESAKR